MRGTHTELLAADGRHGELYRTQFDTEAVDSPRVDDTRDEPATVG